MIKVAITDDHQMVVEGLKYLLSNLSDIEVIATYKNLSETFLGLSNDKPDVLLLDINLPDGNGVLACEDILKLVPDTHIIALTNLEDSTFIKQILKKGAKSYLMKNTSKEELILVINEVMKGEVFLTDKIKTLLLNETLGKTNNRFIPKLTRREKEVLNLIIEELTTLEIAKKLFVSIKTIESHRTNLLQKVGAKNSAGLVRIALEKGLYQKSKE